MLKILLKYYIFEKCIDILFERIKVNFYNKQKNVYLFKEIILEDKDDGTMLEFMNTKVYKDKNEEPYKLVIEYKLCARLDAKSNTWKYHKNGRFMEYFTLFLPFYTIHTPVKFKEIVKKLHEND